MLQSVPASGRARLHVPALLWTALLLSAVVATTPAGAPRAGEGPVLHDLGTRHRFQPAAASPYLPVGCRDHRTLMYVVREIEGEDPGAARQLSERDCRPLVADVDYIRCGPGGYAHPAKGERMTYAAYCRVGVDDLPLYALDKAMAPVAEPAAP
jgi:hypothetical protein